MMYYIRSQCAWKTEKEREKEISLHGQKWEFFTVCVLLVSFGLTEFPRALKLDVLVQFALQILWPSTHLHTISLSLSHSRTHTFPFSLHLVHTFVRFFCCCCCIYANIVSYFFGRPWTAMPLPSQKNNNWNLIFFSALYRTQSSASHR